MKLINGFWIVKGLASFILGCCVLSCHHQNKIKTNFTQDEIINQYLAILDTINDFLFSDDKRLTKEKERYHLMNRIMQMSVAIPDFRN